MTLDELLKQIHSNLETTDDLGQMSDWYFSLASHYSLLAQDLAKVKRDRAMKELSIKQSLLSEKNGYTEKEIERQYFSTEEGKFYLYAGEMLKAVGKLISAVKFKLELLN